MTCPAFILVIPVRRGVHTASHVVTALPVHTQRIFPRRRAHRLIIPTISASSPSPSSPPSPPSPPTSPSTDGTTALTKVSTAITTLFPVWTVVASAAALTQPTLFTALTAPSVVQGSLSLLMLSMGLTLRPSDLLTAVRRPVPLLFNFMACYILMPALAVLLTQIFALSGTARAGIILLSIVSGGQASNLCTHIAGGDVALSVTLTTATTLAAAAVLPALSNMLLGTTVAVDGLALAVSTARVTLAPVFIGATLGRLAPKWVSRIQHLLPALGVLAVVVLVLGPVAQCASGFNAAWRSLFLPVMLLHVVGGVVGFLLGWGMRCGWRTAVTVAFETGFKSPALSYVLATKCFPDGVQLASAVSIVALAPVAALCAVIVRAAVGKTNKLEDDTNLEVENA